MSGRQSRTASWAEAITNVVVGYAMALLVQATIYPLFGITTTMGQEMAIALVFTIASLLRSYAIRRVFIALEAHAELERLERATRLERRLSTGRP
jgi:hypothetical protein